MIKQDKIFFKKDKRLYGTVWDAGITIRATETISNYHEDILSDKEVKRKLTKNINDEILDIEGLKDLLFEYREFVRRNLQVFRADEMEENLFQKIENFLNE